jgi:predicted protein tyrosine phosphatase
MRPSVYWINAPDVGRLAVVSRPDPAYGLPQQMKALREAGIDTLVSMLDPDEAALVGLAGEAAAAAAASLTFHNLPTGDFGVPPSFEATELIIAQVIQDLSGDRAVGVHCYAGRGRSPLFAAAVLARAGWAPEAAIEAVSAARGRRTPETDAQRQWIIDFARWYRERG